MFPIAMAERHTVALMGRTKRVDPRCIASVSAFVRRLVEDEYEGSQTKAAKALGVSQGHLSQVLRAADRGPGLPFLIALREATGKRIDVLLGLEPDAAEAPQAGHLDDIRAALRAELEEMRRPPPSEPPTPLLPSPKKGPSNAPRPRRR